MTLKEDPKKHDDYKDFYKRLRINLGDLEGAFELLSWLWWYYN